MFWKNTAWSWDDAAGNDDDDGGYLLAADLRRTPDSAADTDLNHITTTTANTAILSNSISTITAELKDLANPQSLDPTNANYSSYVSTLYSNTNQHQATRNSSTAQRLTVSHTILTCYYTDVTKKMTLHLGLVWS